MQYRQIEELSDGRYSGDIGEHSFASSDQWNAFVESGGDVSYLGNFDNKHELENWDAFVEAMTSGRLDTNSSSGFNEE